MYLARKIISEHIMFDELFVMFIESKSTFNERRFIYEIIVLMKWIVHWVITFLWTWKKFVLLLDTYFVWYHFVWNLFSFWEIFYLIFLSRIISQLIKFVEKHLIIELFNHSLRKTWKMFAMTKFINIMLNYVLAKTCRYHHDWW